MSQANWPSPTPQLRSMSGVTVVPSTDWLRCAPCHVLLPCCCCLRDIILGSEGGALHTTNQDSRSKREGSSSLLLDFKDKNK